MAKKLKNGRQGEGGGPKTKEGKAIAAMNGLKHGKFMTNFQFLKHKAGSLAICKQCGDEQAEMCKTEQRCILHEELTLRYHYTHIKKDPTFIENIAIPQLAMMDMLFSQRLRNAIENIDAVTTEKVYELINFAKALNKSLADMQLTRNTQENIDVEWAKLLEADISAEKADEFKRAMLDKMLKWREDKEIAIKTAKEDQAIQNFIESEGKADIESGDIEIGNLGGSPFGKNAD